MNLFEINKFVELAQWTGCMKTQEFFNSVILQNFPREIAQPPILKLEFPSLESRYMCYFKIWPKFTSKYIYIFDEGHIRKQELKTDLSKPRGCMCDVGTVFQLSHNNRTKVCDNLIVLVKNHSIVEVDIGAGEGDHSLVLLYINGKIYILDSYAKIRTPEIREFDYEEFRNYILNGNLESYNKVFKTEFSHSKDIGSLRDIHISVCEW